MTNHPVIHTEPPHKIAIDKLGDEGHVRLMQLISDIVASNGRATVYVHPELREATKIDAQHKPPTNPTRWWRAIDAGGNVLAETSDPDDFEALDLISKPGVSFQRLYERRQDEWVREVP